MNEVSDQDYWNRPRFGQELTEAAFLHRRAITGSFDRFDGSEDAMDQYFDVTRGRARQESRRLGQILLLEVLVLDTTLERTRMRMRTLAPGLIRI